VIFVTPARGGDVPEAEATERVRCGRDGVDDVTVRRADDDATVRRADDGVVIAEFRGRSRSGNESVMAAGSDAPRD